MASLAPLGEVAGRSLPTYATSATSRDTGRTDAPSTATQPPLHSAQAQVQSHDGGFDSESQGFVDHADFFRSEKHKLTENSVKGKLSKNFSFWKNLGTYDYILDIVKNGYSIPFTKLPPSMNIKNNLSAMKNKSFVQEKVNELLSSGRVVKVPFQPFVVSPLSVAENRTKNVSY